MIVTERTIRDLFRVSLWLKAAHSFVEIVAGLALLFVSHALIVELAQAVTSTELLEDPQDVIAGAIRGFAMTFSPSTQSFAAYYLLSHGLLKLVMVSGVLLDKLWAYPAFMAVLVGFIAYQLYRLSFGMSWALIAVTMLDVVVLALTVHEYRYARGRRVE
ncbi:MAG: DUF2127 domain-containing protein [Rhizobiales bacterium]|nr:DUF2127 domain-containing protein [Hyphomicrobiales bacterium]